MQLLAGDSSVTSGKSGVGRTIAEKKRRKSLARIEKLAERGL